MSINQISGKEYFILYAEIHNVSIPDDKTCGNRAILEKWMSTLPLVLSEMTVSTHITLAWSRPKHQRLPRLISQ